MKPYVFLLILTVLILASACASPSALSTPTNTNLPTSDKDPVQIERGNADVTYVVAEQGEDELWTFSVTVRHPDTGWDDYVNGWDVLLADGTVLKKDSSDPFTRLLTHPHVDEQPFTRSQGGLIIPEVEKVVTVRAHDLVDGFGGETVTVNLELPFGENFEVLRTKSKEENFLGLTNQNLDGNRYVTGQIDLENATEIQIPLNGIPSWVVGVPQNNETSLWLATLQDGSIQFFQVTQEGYSELAPPARSLPPGTPPALRSSSSSISLLNTITQDSAQFTNPIYTPAEELVHISKSGELVINSPNQTISLPINALPDGRILSDEHGNLLLLSEPTSSYQHAVLGDELEANTITLIKNPSSAPSQHVIKIPDGQVIEGIAPIWVDLNSDGQREIIVTLSNAQNGAQLAVFAEAGEIIARSSAIGTGYRWRHQIAVAPFGPNGEIEIVDVLTPHIGGVVEFLSLNGEQLSISAQIRGYTSHVIGSRNLDMALAADFDMDGQIELLLPSQQLDSLGIIQRTENGAEVAFELPLEENLSTNIASLKYKNGAIAIAAGLENGTIKIWLPQQYLD